MKEIKGFKKNIAKHFYDKTITLYTNSDSTDSEGFVTKKATATANTFEGNVAFDNLEQARVDYGITEEVNIKISTHENTALGTIVKYNNVLYKIVGKIPSDSHNMLIGTKWS